MKLAQTVRMTFALLALGLISLRAQQNPKSAGLSYRIDTYLTNGTHHGFSGAIAVIKNGETIINKGYGPANKDTGAPNTPNTIFDIGSNTKQFTAAAILKLVELGKIRVDDPLSKFFPNIPADKQEITIHQLLSHSAGFTDAIGSDFDMITQEDFFDQLFATDLESQPGSTYSYSNTGYSILGRIIELVSGQSYEAFLKQHLFIPAGMQQTGYLLPDWDATKMARGYNRNVLESPPTIERYRETGDLTWHLKANGGINSTQNDMLSWVKALNTNAVLTPESIEKLYTPHVLAPGGNYSYGYGWVVKRTERNALRVSHNGSNGTFSHSIIGYPEENTYIVFATNANSSKVEGIAYEVEKMMKDEAYSPAPIKNNIYAFTMEFLKEHPTDESKTLLDLLRKNYPDEFNNEHLLNTMGNLLLRFNENLDWAVELFKLNVELYPENGNLWDSLGDGYKANNQTEAAVNSYKKAIALGYTGSEEKLAALLQNE